MVSNIMSRDPTSKLISIGRGCISGYPQISVWPRSRESWVFRSPHLDDIECHVSVFYLCPWQAHPIQVRLKIHLVTCVSLFGHARKGFGLLIASFGRYRASCLGSRFVCLEPPFTLSGPLLPRLLKYTWPLIA